MVDLVTYYTVKTTIAAWNYLSHPAPNLEKNAGNIWASKLSSSPSIKLLTNN